MTYENEMLRERVNKMVGNTWKHATTAVTKRDLRSALIGNPALLRDLVKQYQNKPKDKYDYDIDEQMLFRWHEEGQRLAKNHPVSLKLSSAPDLTEIYDVVKKICAQFQTAVEDQGWDRLLYKSDGKPQHESVAQRLFQGLASAYCNANDLDLSPESDAGRGPVDFKISRGLQKVVVEIKLSSNRRIVQGYENQLPIYRRAECAQRGIYLVIDVDTSGEWRKRLTAIGEKARQQDPACPEIITVDGVLKPSASKA